MKIDTLVLEQSKQTRRWRWFTLDSRRRVQHSSDDAHPNGWVNRPQMIDNAESILGAEIELHKERGEYARGQVVGRAIEIEVRRWV